MIVSNDTAYLFLFDPLHDLPVVNEGNRLYVEGYRAYKTERALVLYFAGTRMSEMLNWLHHNKYQFDVLDVKLGSHRTGDPFSCTGIKMEDAHQAALFKTFWYSA